MKLVRILLILSLIPLWTISCSPVGTGSESALLAPTQSALAPSTATQPVSPDPTNTSTNTPVSATSTSTAMNPPTDTVSTVTHSPTARPTKAPTRTPTPTLRPEDWKQFYVIPSVSDSVLKIYQRGLELGNNPHAFSKIGDCGSTPAWFLGDFDLGPQFYRLGIYKDLAKVIEYYQGSYGRTSLAARPGFNASSLFVPLWADRSQCQANEMPIACEYRLHRPVIAFIMLGTNDVWHPDKFEPQMRKIIEFSIENGVIPILSTKADNQEGDNSVNATIARLAVEYDVPLWNFWRAVQNLPDKGLQEDKAHLTWGRNFFDDPEALTKAWPLRNLTALQTLLAIWQKVNRITP